MDRVIEIPKVFIEGTLLICDNPIFPDETVIYIGGDDVTDFIFEHVSDSSDFEYGKDGGRYRLTLERVSDA
jgi:hypothetical protein